MSTMLTKIHLAFITDEGYFLPTAVAISSVANRRDPKVAYVVHVICKDVSSERIEKLLSLSSDDFLISVLDASEKIDYAQFQMSGFPVTPTAILKFELPQILGDVDKVIYLDGDIVVRKDLRELWETDIDGKFVAAVSDRHAFFFKGKTLEERIGYPHDNYFNSGVMLLNLKLMRENRLTEKLYDYRRNGRNDFMDQDALNAIMSGNAKFLPFRYNMIATCLRYSNPKLLSMYYPETYAKDVVELFEQSVIYHYASAAKPWKNINVAFRDVWLEAWRSSPFADEQISDSVYAPEEAEHYNKMLELIGCKRQNAKVSVVIPVHNAQKFLRECISSVLTQDNFPEVEVICVDDGSEDNSPFVAYSMQFRDPRVVVITQKNQFAGVARNNGLSVAHGEYVLFLDADDKLAGRTILAEAYEKAKRERLDVLDMSGFEINAAGKYLHPMNWLLRKELIPEKEVFSRLDMGVNLFLLTAGGPCAKLFRRDFLVENKLSFPALQRSEDFPFTQMAMARAERIGLLDKPILGRRIGNSLSLESTKDKSPLAFLEAENVFYCELKASGLYEEVSAAAHAMSVVRLDYNLLAMRSYEGFAAVYGVVKEFYSRIRLPDSICDAKVYQDAVSRLDAVIDSENAAEYIYSKMKLVLGLLAQIRKKLEAQKVKESKIWAERGAFLAERNALREKVEAQKVKESKIWAERGAFLSERNALREKVEAQKVKEAMIWSQRCKYLEERDKFSSEICNLELNLRKLNGAFKRMESDLNGLRASASYRIGSILTWPFRMVYNLYKTRNG